MSLECLSQLLRRFKHILLRQHPSAPMHTQGLSALGILEDSDRIMRVCMHGAHEPPRIVSADRDQSQIERAAELPYLFESGARGEIKLWRVIVGADGEIWYRSVTSVTEKSKVISRNS